MREAKCIIQKCSKEDPWVYIDKKYKNLIHYYGHRLTKFIYDYEEKKQQRLDHEQNMKIAMVEAYSKYASQPLENVNKVLKTIPTNYCRSYYSNVKNTQKKKHKITIENTADFANLFDFYYEKFINNEYKLTEHSEEYEILTVVINSEEYKEYAGSKKSFMSVNMLRNFFTSIKKWPGHKFDNAIRHIGKEYDSFVIEQYKFAV